MTDAILALNAGSSSIKFALYRAGIGHDPTLASRGQVEGIGSTPHFVARSPDGTTLKEQSWAEAAPSFQSLLETVLAWIESHLGADTLIGVGHRIVHGGIDHDRPERVTAALLSALDDLVPLAPLHQPHNIAPIRAIAATRPNLPQVACFDTAFHRTMPAVATRIALPHAFAEAGVRRYGFHGISYEYIARRLREVAPGLAEGRTIVAHLGNGASLCALQAGRSIETTMGFTALDGLVMGTRCGMLDPGVVLYLQQARGMSAKQIEDMLYRQSGLLALSGGVASDMRTLLASPDPRAQEAIALFVYRIVQLTGAQTSILGGLDGLVFTAGIGERAPAIRDRVCAGLRWLGVELDPEANARNDAVISTPQSRVSIRVIPTDEEAMIARHTLQVIRPG
ncbi:MAG TPA: acetate/propionate family kinase [Acetobacteraceae bacterium]|nr:acetate/propionate family kinase [Acetobacteraceae bacterium]